MKLSQRKIHDDITHDSHAEKIAKDVPPQKISHKVFRLCNKFFAFNKGFLTVGAVFGLWATVGEVVLSHPYKFSTFIGRRGGNVASEEITVALPAEATKQEVVMAAGGAVELKKNCQQLRNQLGQNAFAQCLQRNGTSPVCEFKKQQAEMQPCDNFLAETLVDDFQQKTQGASK